MNTTRTGRWALAVGALGVVFGDIGTSPLYAFRAIFGHTQLSQAMSQSLVYGLVSLAIWSVILVVSVKYLGFIMRANNKGEGGIMALAALLETATIPGRAKFILLILGIAGVSLFYGDSIITPAISVLSAVEGISLVAPRLQPAVVPITLVILTLLFLVQHKGTALIGRLFGPVMLVWFVVMGLGGLWQVLQHPEVLQVLSPLVAARFAFDQPVLTFIAMGAIVLAITGAEALYADMGHFGRGPIARAWFWLVFPALALNYMGQAALINQSPAAIVNPFFFLFPDAVRVPIIILATLATLVASQAVISGAFSLTRQAVQLKYLPRLIVRHTSEQQYGQIYMPFVNWSLFCLVVMLVIGFGSSAQLAAAYGIAVSGTLAIDAILFLAVAYYIWRRPRSDVIIGAIVFLSIDLIFITSNLFKIIHGGWFPLLMAAVIGAIILSWVRGQRIVTQQRLEIEGDLQDFVTQLRDNTSLTRLPGSAVYLSQHPHYTPLALRATVDRLHELHEHIVIVNIKTRTIPHVPEAERISFDPLGYQDDGISHITLSFGFKDTPNIPKALEGTRSAGKEVGFDLDQETYFVSTLKIIPTRHKNLPRWQKFIYALISRNAASPTAYYRLPFERTVELTSYIKL